MEINKLKQKNIVTRNGQFMPLVFVDVYIGAKIIALGGVAAAKQVHDKVTKDMSDIVLKRYDSDAYEDILDIDGLGVL